MSVFNIKDQVLARTYLVLVIVLLVAFTIFSKAVRLNTTEGNKWRKQAEVQQIKEMKYLGTRGNIFADDGSILATSLPVYDIKLDCMSDMSPEVDTVFMNSLDSLSFLLATLLDTSYTVGGYKQFLWQRKMVYVRTADSAANKRNRMLLLKKGVSQEIADTLKTFPFFRLGKLKSGLIVERKDKREIPFDMLANRTIGYIKEKDKDAKPIGIEGYYNELLQGKGGTRPMQKVGPDTWLPIDDLALIAPKDGKDVVSTININLQDITQTALLRALNRHQADHATAIVMEVSTGKIKAFSNIGKVNDGWWENYNYGIGTATEPGSTFKTASMLALLEDNLVKLYDTVDIENGKTQYYDQVMQDHEKTNVKRTTVRNAFAVSSNVGVSKLVFNAYKSKPQQYIQRIREFGLDKPTQVDLLGEAKPYIKNPDDPNDQWSGISLPWMSIGYELKITPLQLLTFYNGIANKGVVMKPYIVSEVQEYGSTISRIPPTILNKRLASQESLKQVQELLETVISDGTGKGIRSGQYQLAGKTGTAQINYAAKGSKPHTGGYQASFVGYFPAQNPRYSCIVIVNNPTVNGFYGGEVAAPVFREIADRCFASDIALSETVNEKGKPILTAESLPQAVGFKEDIEKILKKADIKYLQKANPENDFVSLGARLDTLFVQPRNLLKKGVVPNVIGMGLKDALFVLENKGLRVIFSGYGKVTAQSIGAGVPFSKNQTIRIKLD